MFFDVHCHLIEKTSFLTFNKNNISVIFNGLDFESNKKLLELKKQGNIFIALGMHPTLKFDDRVIYQIKENRDKIIAVGEIGLDYLKVKDKEEMKRNFLKMLELAEEIKKPVIVHSRRAKGRVIEMISNFKVPVIMHSFFGTKEEFDSALKTKCYFSFSRVPAKAEDIDMDRIFLETDSPYILKSPLDVVENYLELSKIKKIDIKTAERQIENNFKRVFLSN